MSQKGPSYGDFSVLKMAAGRQLGFFWKSILTAKLFAEHGL